MTDCELGQEIRNNNESAFNTFFDRHYGWVYRRAFAFMRSNEDAEEAAANVFVKLWQCREKHNPARGKFMTWFHVLCERVLCDASRIKARAEKNCRYGDLETEPERALLEHAPDTYRYPLDTMIADEQMHQIEDALCELPNPKYRMAWILHHLEGYSYEKISEILKAPIATCRGWTYRCRLQLQEALAGYA